MLQSNAEIIAFAHKAAKSAEVGDLNELRAFYTDDARLWLNTTDTWKSIDEHLASIPSSRKHLRGLRYADLRIQPFEGGYLQQCRVQAETDEGGPFDLPICIVFRLTDGKISEREEYVDLSRAKSVQAE